MVRWTVLYKYSSEEYRKGYEKVKLYHPEFTYVSEEPGKFKQQVISFIDSKQQATMFFVDDLVFKAPFFLRSEPVKRFLDDPLIACVALRLCPRINYCYTEKRYTPPPTMTEDLVWFWKDKDLKGDWCYPCSVDANIFRTEDILPIVKNLNYENPNTFEGSFAMHSINRPYMVCYKESIVFNIPVNKVQTVNGNHCGNVPADYLNKEFLNLKRISMLNIAGIKNTACHQEIPICLEKATKFDVTDLETILKNNAVEYRKIIEDSNFYRYITDGVYNINLFIPIKNRHNFLKPCLDYIKDAKSKTALKIRVIVVEDDIMPANKDRCRELGVDYIFVPSYLTNSQGLIAKALLFNIGYMVTPKTSWYVFHDLDILMDNDYFSKLEQYLSRNPLWIQPYTKRRVIRLSKEITDRICLGYRTPLSGLSINDAKPSNPGSPGGSIVVRLDAFENVGGYDPEFFYGYAPEDAFFWVKLECLSGRVDHIGSFFQGGGVFTDDPLIEVYHMDHPLLENLNRFKARMVDILESFLSFNYEDKMKIIDLKKGLLKRSSLEIKL